MRLMGEWEGGTQQLHPGFVPKSEKKAGGPDEGNKGGLDQVVDSPREHDVSNCDQTIEAKA